MVLNSKRIRLEKHRGLILLFTYPLWILGAFLFFQACSGQKEKSTLDIIWENGRATELIVPSTYVKGVPSDSITNLLRVYLSGIENRAAILGDYRSSDEGVIFRPLIPFTSGLTYEVSVDDRVIGKIQIPHNDNRNDLPELVEIYPSQDTLPENLLKLYVRFSHSMREGQALRYITLLKNGVDTVHGTFLDLQPELWNKDYTMLTLWLDPGRIKRDLQPNQALGVPLNSSTSYTLLVRSGWPDTRGAVTSDDFRKEFFVVARDSIRPDINKWVLRAPRENTTEPLVIVLNEPLDAVLLKDALQVTYSAGTPLQGQIALKKEESVVEFTPDSPWRKGFYILQSESRLEDLAGNNLDRLFDRDITKDAASQGQEVYTVRFEIQ